MFARNYIAFLSIAFILHLCPQAIARPPDTIPMPGPVCYAVPGPDSTRTGSIMLKQKNIVSLDILIMFPALGYSRIVPLSDKSALVLYGSITPFFGFLIDTGAALSLGKKHNFFEPGGGYLMHVDAFYLKAGYRYQGTKGFVFRIAPGYNLTEKVPWFTAGFGYAF